MRKWSPEEGDIMKIGSRALLLFVSGIGVVLHAGCTGPVDQPPALAIVDVVSGGGSDVFSIAFERYQTLDEDLPIGIFDSGIGGLTVLNEIVTIDQFDNVTHESGADGRPDFQNESFVYLGDQANMPYGNYPSEDKVAFLKELVLKDVVFILGDRYWTSRTSRQPHRDKPPVKAIVVACNTATSYGLDDIHRALHKWNVPVYTVGVVAAGADGAVEALRSAAAPGAVAVMATVGTCASGGYPREIARSSDEAGMKAPVVIQQGSVGLAGAIEGDPGFIVPADSDVVAEYRGPEVGNAAAPIEPTLIEEYGFEPDGILGDPDRPETWRLNSIENYIRYETTTLVEAYRRGGSSEPITTVVLGCTHFPFHQEAIEASFDRLRSVRDDQGEARYEGLIAEDVAFVDPAHLTAVELYEALAALGLLNDDEDGRSLTADEFYISVPNAACPGVALRPDGLTFTYEYKYGRSPGELDKEYVRRVPMSRENLSESVIETIRTTMPGVWNRLVSFSSHSPRCGDLPAEARIQTAD
jgi:glutamate racemase